MLLQVRLVTQSKALATLSVRLYTGSTAFLSPNQQSQSIT